MAFLPGTVVKTWLSYLVRLSKSMAFLPVMVAKNPWLSYLEKLSKHGFLTWYGCQKHGFLTWYGCQNPWLSYLAWLPKIHVFRTWNSGHKHGFLTWNSCQNPWPWLSYWKSCQNPWFSYLGQVSKSAVFLPGTVVQNSLQLSIGSV